MQTVTVPPELRDDVETLWDYSQMHHEPRAVDLGIGLGSHDRDVPVYTSELYHRGLFPKIVFTGANAPSTVDQFPRGEAVHFRERALELGVPDSAILVEPRATNTGENVDFTRALIEGHKDSSRIRSVMLISRPYQQRRSYAICRKRWPEVEVTCASRPLPLDEYINHIGDLARVINMLVGDTQRLWVYPANGWAIAQAIPEAVRKAFSHLVDAGFDRRLLPER
ncbi:YdcF family protein [Nocardia sp. NBC_01503]|uniref:YdcF family protein n=1 Tax=Nocardia sp. NBC_01503 TaxID=2975997 RepID=UPI002E7C4C44|nr:YdcF family protein [Nocardia sp. NBC_01503]WTL32377.1 YdcF family protein [Nocardia sp. NBC_01503]